MPRVNLGKTKPSKLVALIWGQAEACGVGAERLAAIVGVSKPTMCERKNHPETFRLSELRKICRALDIPMADLIAAFVS